MKKYQAHKSSLFLMELIIAIVFLPWQAVFVCSSS